MVLPLLFISCFLASSSSLVLNINNSTSNHPFIHSGSSLPLQYPYFPQALSPRLKDRPLKNNFKITSICTDCNPQLPAADFHVVLYYRSQNSCEVRVRRLDDAKWNFDIHLRLESIIRNSTGQKDTGELHIIGPSVSSFKSVILTTTVKLEAISEEELLSPQNIPRIIMQTYYTTNATNIYHWNAFQTFVELNSEYEVLLMLDKHCRIFIKKHFPSRVLRAYDALVPKAFKADLFRYCYLYFKGGCYFDNKMINRTPLRNTINPKDDFLVCSDTLPYGIEAKNLKDTKKLYNAVICSAPKDERMLRVIKYVVDTINGNNYGFSDLGITGPVAFYEATKGYVDDSNLRFSHKLGRHPFISTWFPNGHPDHNNGAREYRDYTVNEKTNNHVLLTKFFKGYYSSAYRRCVCVSSLILLSSFYHCLNYHFHSICGCIYHCHYHVNLYYNGIFLNHLLYSFHSCADMVTFGSKVKSFMSHHLFH